MKKILFILSIFLIILSFATSPSQSWEKWESTCPAQKTCDNPSNINDGPGGLCPFGGAIVYCVHPKVREDQNRCPISQTTTCNPGTTQEISSCNPFSITISWDNKLETQRYTRALGYVIERSEDQGGFNEIDRVSLNTHSYTDLSVRLAKTYQYHILLNTIDGVKRFQEDNYAPGYESDSVSTLYCITPTPTISQTPIRIPTTSIPQVTSTPTRTPTTPPNTTPTSTPTTSPGGKNCILVTPTPDPSGKQLQIKNLICITPTP